MSELAPNGLILDKPCNVKKLPGFQEGLVSIQDCGAQLTAHLLDLQENQTVLDACAAPGGKTIHMLELEPKLKELVALDIDQARLEKIQQNLQRTKTSATLLLGDGREPETWQAPDSSNNSPQQSYDRILLDAPCSGTGVINHHPDIKLLRRQTDIAKFAQQQYELLQALWPLLKPGGILLYVTCSILPEENSEQIATFLQETTDAKEVSIEFIQPQVKTPHGLQLLPITKQHDGFYYAKLIKNSGVTS
jgi:16S rRNA (cytosine967-C5)-methyltransferase